ncbi:MAG: LysM peptidoglycan-binding domain-containing protein [Acidobacteria bacterium]|nr:LysM peptidoglycan-binding domain-containing protein [Acidobacteriota bacterium]
MTFSKGAQIAEIAIPGLDSPILQFIRGQNEKLTLELFFDTTTLLKITPALADVRLMTNSIYQLAKIQPRTHSIPVIRFYMGASIQFKAIVENVQQKFTLFNQLGTPLRANVSVTFREYKTLEEQISGTNFQSPDHTKRRVVQRGETLSQIAAEEYDDPEEWRRIADANPDVVTNPRRLAPGAVLEIPPIDLLGASVVKR